MTTIVETFKTKNEYMVEALKYNHDHCKLLYAGKSDKLPNKYLKYFTRAIQLDDYVIIAQQDEPLNNN